MPPERILPNAHVLLRLPSGLTKLLRISPDTTISLGKFGTFPSNALLFRPYNLTFDILSTGALRVVPTSELAADVLGASASDPDSTDPSTPAPESLDIDTAKNNQHTYDTTSSQTLTWQEIEALKRSGGDGRALVNKLLEGHTEIEKKTAFSLQKYTLRKTGKYLKRFTVERLGVAGLLEWLPTAKETYRFLEMRNCQLALMAALANICAGKRVLVIDETGGLVVAAVAEKMGLLHPSDKEEEDGEEEGEREEGSITLVHANEQPNLSMLSYFGYDFNTPDPQHPLSSSLSTLTWLQLLHPEQDTTLVPPPPLSEADAGRQGKRASHARKMRRYEQLKARVEKAREGGFDALVVAAHMAAPDILAALVPLVRGSGQVAVYFPNLQLATETADCYSSARRAVWVQGGSSRGGSGRGQMKEDEGTSIGVDEGQGEGGREGGEGEGGEQAPGKPDPTLALAPTLHQIRVRKWQTLPGRTHPVMTSRGGGEGYVLHATRVLPVKGRVDAKGAFGGRKRKRAEGEEEDGEGKKGKVADEGEDGDGDEKVVVVEMEAEG